VRGDAGDTIVDPGGQAERTRLSWNRTGLALAVNAALLLHSRVGSTLTQVPMLLMLLAALGCFLFANRRYRTVSAAVRNQTPIVVLANIRLLGLAALLPALIALAAVLL
jgi:hypothetical protein